MKTEPRLGQKEPQSVEEVREPRRVRVVLEVSAQDAGIGVYVKHDICNIFSRFHSFVSVFDPY